MLFEIHLPAWDGNTNKTCSNDAVTMILGNNLFNVHVYFGHPPASATFYHSAEILSLSLVSLTLSSVHMINHYIISIHRSPATVPTKSTMSNLGLRK